MLKAIGVYTFIQLALLVFAVVTLLVWDKRYRKNHGFDVPAGFQKTPEITIDPQSGKRIRVYYNPSTGERYYHEENG